MRLADFQAMTHLPAFVSDLAIILITASAVTLVFRRFQWPVVLGYLLAGFLVGPHFPLIHTVSETESVKVWAELGVIVLLFALGLEFSFRRLLKIGRPALMTGLFAILFMLGLGYFTGRLLGWTDMNSLFLGGILSISSTMIIAKSFEEQNLKGRSFATLVMGILIVEDLVAILLLVLLSTIAVSQTVSGAELLGSSARLLFFLVLWSVLGALLVPRFIRWMRPTRRPWSCRWACVWAWC
jgi:CPA2 family monovalent cation:H+ antiporter-2